MSGSGTLINKIDDVNQLVELAKLAEQAERYDDMAKAMNKVTKKKKTLTTEERNLLSVAYKNVVGARRSSWRVICMIEQKADNDKRKTNTKEFREVVEKELDDTCNEVLRLLERDLLQSVVADDEKVFYLKMKGDYYRYMAEYKDGDEGNEREEAIKSAQAAYQEAMDLAKEKMAPSHANRLGLALNYSVFYYEILNSPDKACTLAKEAFEEAVDETNQSQQDPDSKDSTLILQLLRDNLTLWTSDAAENGGDAD